MTFTEALQRAQNWLQQDPDTETRAELTDMMQRAENDTAAQEALIQRFSGRLQFGTAGLRGALQAGPMGMNRVLVAQAAAGLAQYLKIQRSASATVILGYDARKNSEQFARDSAEIMAGAGLKALLLPQMTPTPVLAFALRHLRADAAVMVTASHNPPQDNGYKVYLGGDNGDGQIIAPADAAIAACIEEVAAGDIRHLPRSSDYQVLGTDIISAYVSETAKVRQSAFQPLNYVYTAMHGVGRDVFLEALRAANLPLPIEVAAQNQPDGRFPTVSFPNPEEKGALDLAIQTASAAQADFIVAHDPDADRLAVAIPEKDGWKALHGNTLGCYLAWFLMQRAQKQGLQGCVANSLVSSPALEKMAREMGFAYQSTLTGFKYISKVPNLLFGYEEALGYLVDADKVRDKDGISAALAFLDLMSNLRAEGRTLADYARDFETAFGAFASGQISVRVQDLADIPRLMDSLRQRPPAALGSSAVTETVDYQQRPERENILIYRLQNGGRLIVRPSGTEPKVKCYLDVEAQDAPTAAALLAELERAVHALLKEHQS